MSEPMKPTAPPAPASPGCPHEFIQSMSDQEFEQFVGDAERLAALPTIEPKPVQTRQPAAMRHDSQLAAASQDTPLAAAPTPASNGSDLPTVVSVFGKPERLHSGVWQIFRHNGSMCLQAIVVLKGQSESVEVPGVYVRVADCLDVIPNGGWHPAQPSGRVEEQQQVTTLRQQLAGQTSLAMALQQRAVELEQQVAGLTRELESQKQAFMVCYNARNHYEQRTDDAERERDELREAARSGTR